MPTVTLHNAQSGYQAMRKAWAWAKPMLIAGHRLTLTLKAEKRSAPQNAKLHATIDEIARQCEWAGRKWDAEVWKRLLVAAWMRASGEHVLVVPALDGAGVDVVFERTSRLTRAQCSDLLEYVSAWAAQNGVRCAIEEQ